MKKKILPLFLSLVMLFTTLFTIPVFAEDTAEPKNATTAGTPDAADEEFYASLKLEEQMTKKNWAPDRHTAQDWPWAVFTSDDGESWTLQNIYKLFTHNENGNSTLQSALGRAEQFSNKYVLIYLRTDYTWRSLDKGNLAAISMDFNNKAQTPGKYYYNSATGEYDQAYVGNNSANTLRLYVTHMADTYLDNLSNITAENIIIDLGGHSFDADGNYLLGWNNKNGSGNAVNFTIRNGNIPNVSNWLTIFQDNNTALDGGNKSINLALDNLAITTAANIENPLFQRVTNGTGNKIINTDITVEGCNIDLSASSADYDLAYTNDIWGTQKGAMKVTFKNSTFNSPALYTDDESSLVNILREYSKHDAYNGLSYTFEGNTVIGQTLPKINNVSVSVGESLSLNYYTNIDAQDKDAYTVQVDGETIAPKVNDENKVLFTFDGIGPHQIGEVFEAKLYRGEELVGTKTYSVENYLHDLYNTGDNASDDTIVNVIRAIINYGRAAQAYLSLPVTISFPEGMAVTDTGIDASALKDTEGYVEYTLSEANKTADTYIASAGVRFDTVNKIYFKISAASAPSVTLNGETVTLTEEDKVGGYYVVYTDAIAPTAYDTVFTLTVGEVTITYSVYNYIAAMDGDAQIGALVDALYAYNLTVNAYANPAA